MTNKTLLQTFILAAIQQMPKGEPISLHVLYRTVQAFLLNGRLPGAPSDMTDFCNALQKCVERGELPNEPSFKNDVRWAIRHAKDAKLIKHVGTPKSGEWVRTETTFSGPWSPSFHPQPTNPVEN